MKRKAYFIWSHKFDECRFNELSDDDFLAEVKEIKEQSNYEYKIREVVRLNSTDNYKCVAIREIKNQIYFYFKKGTITYNYDW